MPDVRSGHSASRESDEGMFQMTRQSGRLLGETLWDVSISIPWGVGSLPWVRGLGESSARCAFPSWKVPRGFYPASLPVSNRQKTMKPAVQAQGKQHTTQTHTDTQHAGVLLSLHRLDLFLLGDMSLLVVVVLSWSLVSNTTGKTVGRGVRV